MLEIKTVKYPGSLPANIGREERLGTLATGLLMVLFSLWRRSLGSIILLPVGLYMIYRSVSGHCYIYEYLGISTLGTREPMAEEVPPTGVGPEDEVAESSWESFPTSDAPAWTMGRERRD